MGTSVAVANTPPMSKLVDLPLSRERTKYDLRRIVYLIPVELVSLYRHLWRSPIRTLRILGFIP